MKAEAGRGRFRRSTGCAAAAVWMAMLPAARGAGFVLHQDLVYRTAGGSGLRLDLAVPAGPGPFPAVVCLHGGGWIAGDRRAFHPMLKALAGVGFAAATVQYRFAPRAPFPAQLEDARCAVRYLRANADRWRIDRQRIAAMGASAGGHLALLLALTAAPDGLEDGCHAGHSGAVAAAVDISGPADLTAWRVEPGVDAGLRKVYGKDFDAVMADVFGPGGRAGPGARRASPVHHVDAGDPPVLVIQWERDPSVPRDQAERLVRALERAGVEHEYVLFEGVGHALQGAGAERIAPLAIRFLNRVFRR